MVHWVHRGEKGMPLDAALCEAPPHPRPSTVVLAVLRPLLILPSITSLTSQPEQKLEPQAGGPSWELFIT